MSGTAPFKATEAGRSRRATVSRRLAEQLIQPDIDLARRADVADLKTVGRKTILHQPDLLGAYHFLHAVRNDEAGRGRRRKPTAA